MAMSWVWSRSDWELTVLGLNRGEMGSPNTWERGGEGGVKPGFPRSKEGGLARVLHLREEEVGLDSWSLVPSLRHLSHGCPHRPGP